MASKNEQAAIESFSGLTERLCEFWGDTKNKLDEHVDLFLTSAMIAIIDSMPNNASKLTKQELNDMFAADDELEFLSDMLKTGCRHNNYASNSHE